MTRAMDMIKTAGLAGLASRSAKWVGNNKGKAAWEAIGLGSIGSLGYSNHKLKGKNGDLKDEVNAHREANAVRGGLKTYQKMQ